MQAIAFGEHLERIRTLLHLAEFEDILPRRMNDPSLNNQISREQKDRLHDLFLDINAAVRELKGTDTWQVLQALDLEWISQPGTIAALIGDVSRADTFSSLGAGDIFSAERWSTLTFQFGALDKYLKAYQTFVVGPKLKALAEGWDRVEFVIPDDDSDGVSLDEFLQITTSVRRLVEAIGQIYEWDGEPIVRYADSGSDIRLGIEAGTKVVDAIRGVFNDVIGFVMFRSFIKHGYTVKAISKSLKLYSEINEKAASGRITQEQQVRLENEVTEALDHLTGKGVLPRMSADENVRIAVHRELLQRHGQLQIGQVATEAITQEPADTGGEPEPED